MNDVLERLTLSGMRGTLLLHTRVAFGAFFPVHDFWINMPTDTLLVPPALQAPKEDFGSANTADALAWGLRIRVMDRVGIRIKVHEDILLDQTLEPIGSSENASKDLRIIRLSNCVIQPG